MGLFQLFGAPNIPRLLENRNWRGLIRTLWHRDPAIAKAAALALGDLQTIDAVDPLVKVMVKHSSPVVCRAAGKALKMILTPEVAYRIPDVLDYFWPSKSTEVAALLNSSKVKALHDKHFNERVLRSIAYLKHSDYACFIVSQWKKKSIPNQQYCENLLREMQEGALPTLISEMFGNGPAFQIVAERILQENAALGLKMALDKIYDNRDLSGNTTSLLIHTSRAVPADQVQEMAESGVETALKQLSEPDAFTKRRAFLVLQSLAPRLPAGSPLRTKVLSQLHRLLDADNDAREVLLTQITLGEIPDARKVIAYLPPTSDDAMIVFQHMVYAGAPPPHQVVEECLRQMYRDGPSVDSGSIDSGRQRQLRKDAEDHCLSLLDTMGGAQDAETRVIYWIMKRDFYKCVPEGAVAVPYLMRGLGVEADYYESSGGYFRTTVSSMAEDALSRIGGAAVPALIQAANDSAGDLAKARAAISVLANIADAECMSALWHLLANKILPEDVEKALDHVRAKRRSEGYH